MRLPLRLALPAAAAVIMAAGLLFTRYESYSSLYDADYVGSEACAPCHGEVYAKWKGSPHALMTRKPSPSSVVGDFSAGAWVPPPRARRGPLDEKPAARMVRREGEWFMDLRHPVEDRFHAFRVDYVVGYQHRQVYLTREPGGILRRLPLQWSVARREFFPYWNLQEDSDPTVEDLWSQMDTTNSAWNLFCARCHVTKLAVELADHRERRALAHWSEDGIACEACHGPGSHHVNYFATNRVNRLAAFLNSRVRRQPVAYIAMAPRLTKGQDLSVCARCHGPDIVDGVTTEIYRRYEPGYSREGRVNDLSAHFKEWPLEPGRKTPHTMECWDDGRPKGIGMLFRSFIESACHEKGEPRCYDCHDSHANHLPARPGLLEASEASNRYCLSCHGHLAGREEEHTGHARGTPGSFCYDCHMPRHIQNLAGGFNRPVRTHWMSSIPDPSATRRLGAAGSPNACNDCHADRTPEWAEREMSRLWPR